MLRWALVLLFLLLAVASRFGLDVVLGAVLAGMVLRRWTRRMNVDATGLEHKFDAVGYGIFIPIFFVASGMMLDLRAITQDLLRLLIFFVLLLLVRGLPALLVYRRRLAAPGDDVHHGDLDAAAGRTRGDRRAGRGHAPRHRGRSGRRGSAVSAGVSAHRSHAAPGSATCNRDRRGPGGLRSGPALANRYRLPRRPLPSTLDLIGSWLAAPIMCVRAA